MSLLHPAVFYETLDHYDCSLAMVRLIVGHSIHPASLHHPPSSKTSLPKSISLIPNSSNFPMRDPRGQLNTQSDHLKVRQAISFLKGKVPANRSRIRAILRVCNMDGTMGRHRRMKLREGRRYSGP